MIYDLGVIIFLIGSAAAGLCVAKVMSQLVFGLKKIFAPEDQRLNELETHSRQFFKYSRPILETDAAREQDIRSIILLCRAHEDRNAARKFYEAFRKLQRKDKTDEYQSEQYKSDDDYVNALIHGLFSISYTHWFWGILLRIKLEHILADGKNVKQAEPILRDMQSSFFTISGSQPQHA
jgi:hypothetical protein